MMCIHIYIYSTSSSRPKQCVAVAISEWVPNLSETVSRPLNVCCLTSPSDL